MCNIFGVITHARNDQNWIGVDPSVFPQLSISWDQVSSFQFCRLHFWALDFSRALDFVSSTVWKYVLRPNLQTSWSHKENTARGGCEAQEKHTGDDCAVPGPGGAAWGVLSGGPAELKPASLGPQPGPRLAKLWAQCKACLFRAAAETSLGYSQREDTVQGVVDFILFFLYFVVREILDYKEICLSLMFRIVIQEVQGRCTIMRGQY